MGSTLTSTLPPCYCDTHPTQQHDGKCRGKHVERDGHTRYARKFLFSIYFTNYLCYYSVLPPLPTHTHPTQHTPRATSTPNTQNVPPLARFGCSAPSSPTLPIPPALANMNMKNAFLGTCFSCSWFPSPHPQLPNIKNTQQRVFSVQQLPHPLFTLNTKNAPLWAHSWCSACSSTSSMPFGACSMCSTSSSPPLTSNTLNMPFWARSTCSA